MAKKPEAETSPSKKPPSETWAIVGKIATVVGLVLTLVRITTLLSTPGVKLAAYCDHSDVSLPRNLLEQTFSSHIDINEVVSPEGMVSILRQEPEINTSLSSAQLTEISGRMASSISEAMDGMLANTILPSLIPTRLITCDVENRGELPANEVIFDFDYVSSHNYVTAAAEYFEGIQAEHITPNSVDIGQVRPGQSRIIQIWLQNAFSFEMKLTHSNGPGHLFWAQYSYGLPGILRDPFGFVQDRPILYFSLLFGLALIIAFLSILIARRIKENKTRNNLDE